MRLINAKSWASSLFSATAVRAIPAPWHSFWLFTAAKLAGYPEVASYPVDKQRGLRAFWLNGLFASMAISFVEPYYTLYLLSLHATNAQIGLVSTLSQFVGAVTSIPGAILADRTGRYRRISLMTSIISRRLWLVMLVAPWMPYDAGAVWLVIIAWIALAGIGALGNGAWTALAAELVPLKVRGSYFASRNMIMHLAQLLVIPLAGLIVSTLGEPAGYQVNLALAFAFGLIARHFFRQLPEHIAVPQTERHSIYKTFQAALRMPTFVRFLAAHSVFHLGVMIGGPFINVYLVQEAKLSVGTIGLSTTLGVFASMIGMRILGRLHDQHGIIWTMRFGLVVPLIPVAYLWVSQPWQAYLISVFSAVTWVGYNLGAFNLLLASTPDEHRPHYIAIHATIVSVVGAIGPIVGGGLLDSIGFGLVFGLSGIGRALGLILLFVLVHEPEAEKNELLPNTN